MKRVIPILAMLALVAGACGGSGGVQIDDAWARTSAATQNAGAVYMVISGGDEHDLLTGASVASTVAAVAEVHETSMASDGSGSMSMQQVPNIAVLAGETVVLEPGGFHIMLMQLAEPLETGAEFTVTLTFEKAGAMDVKVTVREG